MWDRQGTWACLREAMAWGLRAAWGGVGIEEEMSGVMVPIMAPMAAPWTPLVAVTTAASTSKDCFDNQDLKPSSNSLYLNCTNLTGSWLGSSLDTITPCLPCCSISFFPTTLLPPPLLLRAMWIEKDTGEEKDFTLSFFCFYSLHFLFLQLRCYRFSSGFFLIT